jgi:hypothetical protein
LLTVAQPAAKSFRCGEEKHLSGSTEPKCAPNVFQRTQSKSGVAMQYRNEIVPLAVMGSLTAAIMVVFAVTVMH